MRYETSDDFFEYYVPHVRRVTDRLIRDWTNGIDLPHEVDTYVTSVVTNKFVRWNGWADIADIAEHMTGIAPPPTPSPERLREMAMAED